MVKDFHLLGVTGRDRVTKFEGVITCVSYDLYGCIQVIITPEIDKDGKAQEGRWFDTKRIEVTNPTPVMAMPNFTEEAEVIGSEVKPDGRL